MGQGNSPGLPDLKGDVVGCLRSLHARAALDQLGTDLVKILRDGEGFY